jgi:hypothetical protein
VDAAAVSVGQAAADSGLNVLMLVALRDSSNADALDELRERRILWALDNGFEYIEIDALRPINGAYLRLYMNCCYDLKLMACHQVTICEKRRACPD